MEKPIKKITVTGGGGQLSYSLLFRIASGEMLGEDQPIELRILELPVATKVLDGVIMELEDCAFPLLKKIHGSTDPYDAFDGVHYALLVGAKPRGPGMERKDLLFENSKIFVEQGKALNEKAAKDVIVLVVGNPCNTNAHTALINAPNIDKKRFFAMTRLDQNRASGQLAIKANAEVSKVKNMTIWGNHSATQVPDFVHTTIDGKPAEEIIGDRKWLETEFLETVQKRGGAIINARGKSSAASAANAVIDTIRSIIEPTPKGEWFSVGLFSNQNPYGIDKDLIFSFPCQSKGDGEIEIVPDLSWDPFLKEKIALSEKELIEERELLKG